MGSQAGLRGTSVDRREVPLWKRILDVSIILTAAPFWAPVMLGIAVGIKILSPGPALFQQERVGLRGRRFVCLKFRTMHTGASTQAHEQHLAELMQSNRPMTKLDGQDARLIPLAWMLRSTGLDELPQLFNVLRGEMSLVGPRPCTPREYDAYSQAQRARVGTLPGLTGLWQVSGKNRTTFEEMIELDVRYLRTLCLWLDVGIMLRTPVALFVQVAETILARRLAGSSPGAVLPTRAGKRPALGARFRRKCERIAHGTRFPAKSPPSLSKINPSRVQPHHEAAPSSVSASLRWHRGA